MDTSPTDERIDPVTHTPLVFEETPVIEPVSDDGPSPKELERHLDSEARLPDPLAAPKLPVHVQERSGRLTHIVIFIILFLVGIALSIVVRPLVPQAGVSLFPATPTPDFYVEVTPTVTNDQEGLPDTSVWKPYAVVVGSLKEPSGITLKLPPDITEPLCDGNACPSYGTYLPGGTRLTIAVKHQTSTVDTFAQTIITDANGLRFEASDATVAGKLAREYAGSFVGLTTGGYRFTRMHGHMIRVDGTATLEINHFTPSGIEADFDGDDGLFEAIVTTILAK